MEDIIARLSQVPLFASLSHDKKAKLATIVMRRDFPRGSTVVRQGNFGTTLFIVNSGEIVAVAEDERETGLQAAYDHQLLDGDGKPLDPHASEARAS